MDEHIAANHMLLTWSKQPLLIQHPDFASILNHIPGCLPSNSEDSDLIGLLLRLLHVVT